jgi:hypothetical protein
MVKGIQQQTNNTHGGDIMKENRTEDYWTNDGEGHVDTRERNFKCENPDRHLGCDLGIDVAG